MVELFSLVPSLLIVQFFRRIRPRQQIPTLYQIKSSTQFSNPVKKKAFQVTFPWWCLFIAYILSFLIIVVSIFFIIVRGIEFGDLKTQKWLTSIVTGFFSSVFLTQPIKIVCLAIFFICFCRNSNDEKEEVDINQFEIDQDDLQTIEVCFVFRIEE
jgi:hypothetical protein